MSTLGDVGTGAALGTAITPGVGTLIGAGAGLVGSLVGDLINSSSNSNAQNKAEQFAIENFNLMNAYNSPSAQMARLKAAGLNPALAYGNGSIANTGGNISTPSVTANNPGNAVRDSSVALGGAVTQYFNLMQQVAQTNNVQAQTANTIANTTRTESDNAVYNDPGVIEARKATIGLDQEVTGQTFQNLVQQYDQNAKTNPLALQQLVYQVANSALIPGMTKADIAYRLKQVDFTEMQNQLMKIGIEPGSGDISTIVGGILHKLFPNFSLLK